MYPVNRDAVIDEYAELLPLVRRAEELRSQIVSWYADAAAEQEYLVDTGQSVLGVSPRKFQRKIADIGKLFRRLKHGVFLDHCSFTLTALDRCLPESEQADFIVSDRTGAREIRCWAKQASRVA